MSELSSKFQNVTEENIVILVNQFYDRVKQDDALGEIFAREVDDWDHHLPKMYDFWSSVMLKSGRYNGRPVPAHMKIVGLTQDHFSRWLVMFDQITHDLYAPDIADIFVKKSQMIAKSLQMALETVEDSPFNENKPKPKGWIPVQ